MADDGLSPLLLQVAHFDTRTRLFFGSAEGSAAEPLSGPSGTQCPEGGEDER
jgi:hypothetical protein